MINTHITHTDDYFNFSHRIKGIFHVYPSFRSECKAQENKALHSETIVNILIYHSKGSQRPIIAHLY